MEVCLPTDTPLERHQLRPELAACLDRSRQWQEGGSLPQQLSQKTGFPAAGTSWVLGEQLGMPMPTGPCCATPLAEASGKRVTWVCREGHTVGGSSHGCSVVAQPRHSAKDRQRPHPAPPEDDQGVGTDAGAPLSGPCLWATLFRTRTGPEEHGSCSSPSGLLALLPCSGGHGGGREQSHSGPAVGHTARPASCFSLDSAPGWVWVQGFCHLPRPLPGPQ